MYLLCNNTSLRYYYNRIGNPIILDSTLMFIPTNHTNYLTPRQVFKSENAMQRFLNTSKNYYRGLQIFLKYYILEKYNISYEKIISPAYDGHAITSACLIVFM